MNAQDAPKEVPQTAKEWIGAMMAQKDSSFTEIDNDYYEVMAASLAGIAKSGGLDELEKISKSIGQAAGAFSDARVYARLLDGLLGSVYAKPAHCGALGALLGGIGIEDAKTDNPAYVVLDTVRVALRNLRLAEDEMCESRQALLGHCYDALRRAASRNGLDGIAKSMASPDTRSEFCAKDAKISNMARLRISIYEKRDLPTDDEIHEALAKYPDLAQIIDVGNIIKSRDRLSPLTQDMSLNLKHEYALLYTVMSENTIRLQFWTQRIYWQHGIHDEFYIGNQHITKFQSPSFERTDPIMSVRYLLLELWNFKELLKPVYGRVMKTLDVEDPKQLYRLLADVNDTLSSIRTMRNTLVAHPTQPLSEVAKEINKLTLGAIMHCARAVRLFQDAFRAIPGKYHTPGKAELIFLPFSIEIGSIEDKNSSDPTHRGIFSPRDAIQDEDKYIILLELFLSLLVLYDIFVNCLQATQQKTFDATLQLTTAIYNIKYMILELHNFITIFDQLGLQAEPAPKFLDRAPSYRDIRNHYCGHAYESKDKIKSLDQLLKENNISYSDIAHDIEEIIALFRISEINPPDYSPDTVQLMAEKEIMDIDHDIETSRLISHKLFNGRFVDHNEEQKKHANLEKFKKEYEQKQYKLTHDSSVGELANAPNYESSTIKPRMVYLKMANDAITKIGTSSFPPEWTDDLLQGDYYAALAKLRVCAQFVAHDLTFVPQCRDRPNVTLDFSAKMNGEKCWFAVCLLENELRLLIDNERSMMTRGSQDYKRRSKQVTTAHIVEMARQRFGALSGWEAQAIMVLVDPTDMIGDCGGLEDALEAIGHEVSSISALAIERDGIYELHDVPGTDNALAKPVREALCNMGKKNAAP